MKKCYSLGVFLPAFSLKRKGLPMLCVLLLIGLLPLAANAQTTYDFSTPATILKVNPGDFYNLKAEFTSGGVVYVVSGGINGNYSNSSTDGYNNTASLKKEAANREDITIKRKDGKAFLFYGLWVKYTNGTFGTGPGFKMDYKFGCTIVKTFTHSPLTATAIPNDAGGITVTELALTFSYLSNFYLDNIITGAAGNLPPVITPSNCNDQVRNITIPSKTRNVTTVEASDDNNDVLTYSICCADAAKFTIDATGKLAFKTMPVVNPPGDANGDGIYTVVVTVSDGKGGTDSQTINVNIQEADIVFAGCDNFTYGAVAFLKRTAALNVEQGGVTRYGYTTSQEFMDANWFHVTIRWNAATLKWIITTEDEFYGTTIMYSSTKNTYPYPPDITSGTWVANTNLPDGYGSCGTITTLTGEVTGKPLATTAVVTAQDITGSSAKLTGTVSDAWVTTNVSFEYGTSATLASFQTVVSTPAVITAGAGETAVSATITGLQRSTQYYFRVKATNSLGTTTGAIQSFVTPSTLPVSLLHLAARKDGKGGVAVSWSTSSEKNNSHFLVERSADGISYQPIGRVEGSRNANTTTEYEYVDNTPVAGANYYRVTQTDMNGSTRVLGICKVDMKKLAAVRVYPNPVESDQLWIYSEPVSGKPLSFSLVGLSGKILLRGSLPSAATAISTSGFAKGIYLLEISNGQKIKVTIR
ncbi:MAG TPA: T9SS type A sorting domain-containing protein [Flavisolibacter sp.]|nr:T9SS type A sorting domain-containing protein [Flavisolibacter sp.]